MRKQQYNFKRCSRSVLARCGSRLRHSECAHRARTALSGLDKPLQSKLRVVRWRLTTIEEL
jgi:hypothetical protein